MKIKEFVEQMKEDNVDISTLISVKKYISFDDKIRMAKEIMDFCVDYERGFIKPDSIKKHLTFNFSVIEMHTDLRFAEDWDSKVQEYDLLCENELFDAIINTFQRDYYASRDVLNMVCTDMISESSLEASMAKLTRGVIENLDIFVGAVADKLEEIDIEKIIPKDLDLNKLTRLLNNFK